jgi:hypothetical protein
VEVDRRPAPGGLVQQPVHVPGEENTAGGIRFKAGQSVMRVVGQGGPDRVVASSATFRQPAVSSNQW